MDQISNSFQILNQENVDMILNNGGSGGSADNETMLIQKLMMPIINQQSKSQSVAGIRIERQEYNSNSSLILQKNDNLFNQTQIDGKYQTCKVKDFKDQNEQFGSNIDSLHVETTMNQKNLKAQSEDDFLKQVNAESKEDFMNRLQEFENEESAIEDERKIEIQNSVSQPINTIIEFENIMKDHANITTSSKSSKFTPNSKLGQSEFEFQDMIISENFISFFQQQNMQNQLLENQGQTKIPITTMIQQKQKMVLGNPKFMLNPLNFTQIQEKILMNDTISLSKLEYTQKQEKSQSTISQEQTQYQLFQNIIQQNSAVQEDLNTPYKQQNQIINNNYNEQLIPENLNHTQGTVLAQMPLKVQNQIDDQNINNKTMLINQIVDENVKYQNTSLNQKNQFGNINSQINQTVNNQFLIDQQEFLNKFQKNYQCQFIAKNKKSDISSSYFDEQHIQYQTLQNENLIEKETIKNQKIDNQSKQLINEWDEQNKENQSFLENSLQDQTMKKESQQAVECILEQTAELKKILRQNNNEIQESKIKLLQDAIQSQINRIYLEDQQVSQLIQQSHQNINLYSTKINSIQEILFQIQNHQLQNIIIKINQLNQGIFQINIHNDEEANLQSNFIQLEDQINVYKQLKIIETQKAKQLENKIKILQQTEKNEIRSSTETSLHFDVLKKLPLVQEMEALSDQLDKYKEEQFKLNLQNNRNEERLMMLQEDYSMSKQQLMRQVIEREEFELQCGFLLSERGQQCIPEKQIIAQFMYQMKITPECRPEGMSQESKIQIFNYLIDNQKRQLLMNLIRQLQQYMLSINSATTESSMANSDSLDTLTFQIQNVKISIVQAIQSICQHTNAIMLQQKNCEQANDLNQQIIMTQLQDFEKQFDWQRADILTHEVWKDMVYLNKLNLVIEKTSFKIKIHIEAQIDYIQKENLNLEQFQNSLSKQISQIQDRQQSIKQYFDSKQQESVQNSHLLKQLNSQINQLQHELSEQESKVQQLNTQFEIVLNKQQFIQSKIEGIQNNKDYQTEILKKEINQLQNEKTSLLNQEKILEKEIRESQFLKQEAENLLSYSLNRKNELKESLAIARQAIDQSVNGTNINFNLQTSEFQEERPQKIDNENSSMLISQCVYGETQSSRISNIQDKSQNLIHGKILSPSSKKKKGQKVNLNQIMDLRIIDSSCYDEEDNCAERAQISQHNLTEMSSIKGYKNNQLNQISDYTDSNKLIEFQRKHDNHILKQIIMNNSAKLSKQSCDTNNNPLDSNLQRSDFDLQKLQSNYQIQRDQNQSINLNLTDDIKIQNEMIRQKYGRIEEQSKKQKTGENENIKILLCSSAYNSVQKSIQPVSGQTTALNSCIQSQASTSKEIDQLKNQFANQDLTLSMLVVDPQIQNNFDRFCDFQQKPHKNEQSSKIINLRDLANQSKLNIQDESKQNEKQQLKNVSQDIYDPYEKLEPNSINQYKQMNFNITENENLQQQKQLSQEIQNLLNNEPIDPLLDQIHLQQMKIHNQIKQFQQNMNDQNSSDNNKSNDSRSKQYKKHTVSSQMKVNFNQSDVQQNRSLSQKQKKKMQKNLANQQIEMVNNKPYGNTFSGNNNSRLSSQNDILMQQLNNKSLYAVQNCIYNQEIDNSKLQKQYADEIDQIHKYQKDFQNERRLNNNFEEYKQFQQNNGLENSQLQNRLQFQNQSLQFSNFDSSYQGDKFTDSQLYIQQNQPQRQPQIMNQIRKISSHSLDSNQIIQENNDKNNYQNKVFRESQSSTLAQNLKKIGHLSDVGQVLTIDNINQKIRHHLGQSQTQMNNGNRAYSMQSKELKDLKIAYQIQCERNNKKQKTQGNRLRSGSSLNAKYLQAVTSQRKNHRSSSAISIYNSQHENIQEAQKYQCVSQKKFNQQSPKIGKQKMCYDNIFNQSTFNYQSQKFEDHQLNMKAQQVLGIMQQKNLQYNKSKDSSENFKEKINVPQKPWIQQLRQSQTTPIIKLINQKSLQRKKSTTNDQINNFSESVIKSDISGNRTFNRAIVNTSQVIKNGQNNSIEQLQNSIMRVQIDPNVSYLPTNNNVTINTQSSMITQNTPSIFRNQIKDNQKLKQTTASNIRYINLNQSFQNMSKTENPSRMMAYEIINSNKNSKADLLIQRLSQVYKMQKRSYSSQGCAQKDLLNQIQNEKAKNAKSNSHQRYNQHMTQIVKQQLNQCTNQFQGKEANQQLKRPKSSSGLGINNKCTVPNAFANLIKNNQNTSQISLQNSQFQNYQTLEAPSSTLSQINQNILQQANFQNTVTRSETQEQQDKLVKIEFKRYEPNKNQIETYIARVPAGQDKIINFFTMIAPLIEGCNFLDMISRPYSDGNNKLKIELVPRSIDKLMIFKGSQVGIQVLEHTINVKNIQNVKIPQDTLEEIKRYKKDCGLGENNSTEYLFSFYVLLQIPLQELDQDTTMMSGSRSDFNQITSLQFSNEIQDNLQSLKFKNMKFQLGTNNYMDLKRWVLGLNLLIQNQNTLNRLGRMMILQK